jgi:hypothetical protein
VIGSQLEKRDFVFIFSFSISVGRNLGLWQGEGAAGDRGSLACH